MNCENVKAFCDRFNYAVENYEDKDGKDFIKIWELELVKALLQDFGEETMSMVGNIILDLAR